MISDALFSFHAQVAYLVHVNCHGPSDPKLVENLWAWNNSFILLMDPQINGWRLVVLYCLLVRMAWNGSFILLMDPKIKGWKETWRLGDLYL